MVSVSDFVIIRFATKTYSFMRFGHEQLDAWLERKGIQYVRHGQRVYFELPEELKRYQVIDAALCLELRPAATEIKMKLAAISWSKLRQFRDRLSDNELRLLADADIQVIL